MERYFKLSFMLSLSAVIPQLGAMGPELMHRLLGQKEILEAICNNLSEKEMNRLSQVNRQIRGYVGPVIDKHITERAINYSKALTARELNCSHQRQNFADNSSFRNNVLKSMRDFAAQNPGIWIKLNLKNNNLSNDPKFFEQLMQDIITLVHELKIDIAKLYLAGNSLTVLPECILVELRHLQRLYLDDNVQVLELQANQLQALPDNIFAGLPHLQVLNLAGNQLQELSRIYFAGLSHLQVLDLRGNQLPANQVLAVPQGCVVMR